MVSNSTKEFFPHDVIRPGQQDLINDCEKALENNKILLAHAPTGLGKTASALSVAMKEAIDNNKVVFFLTNRHTQHQIAVDTLKKIKHKTQKNFTCVDLIGKRWMCNQQVAGLFGSDFNEYCKAIVEKGECEFYNNVKNKTKLSVSAESFIKSVYEPLHTEELIQQTREKRLCSYEISLAMAKKADVLIGDYYYLFNPFIQSTLLNKMEKDISDIIVIVDEGHNLPNRVTEMMSNNLTSNMIKNSLIEAKKFGYTGMIEWLQGLMSILTNLAQFEKEKEKTVTQEQFVRQVNMVHNYDDLINELELAADEIRKKQRRSYLGGIAAFLEAWQGDDDGFVRIITEQSSKYGPLISLQYSCLDPSIVTKDIFEKVHAGIIMSGTLQPTFMYKDILGIANSIEKEYSSPFPPENKISLIIPETSTKFTLRGDAMYQKIAEHCSQLSNLIPGNVALFFPSYFLRDAISPMLNSNKKRFWEKATMNKEEKEELLNEFKKDKNGILLAVSGANFAEGVDFPGDLLNGVVVIGLPLAKPNLKTKALISYYDGKFGKGWDYGYTYPAFSKCVQSAGRCIRSGTDKGVIAYLDERFTWQRYYNCFPDKVGLIVKRDYQELINNFWS